MKEVIGIENLGCGFGILIISFHGVIATVTHFALYTYRTFFTRLRVKHFHFCKFEITAYCIATYVKRVVNAGGSHTGSGFCESVDAGHFHIHFLFHLLHQLYRAEGTCHDTRT